MYDDRGIAKKFGFPLRNANLSAMPGVLYCGDNLHVLREFVASSSVDLVYLDPPFNSRRNYNLIYKGSKAQELAFKDYWAWDDEAAATYHHLVQGEAPRAVRVLLKALHDVLIDTDSDTLAYLSMMTVRLLELHRVLKKTGSLYLHCDPTASHYLKLILDVIFGAENFRNEIIWKRTGAHNSAGGFGPAHDVLLFYGRSQLARCAPMSATHSAKYLKKFSKVDDITGKNFQDVTLTGPGIRRGDSGKPWRGFDPTEKKRHWQPASYVYEKYEALTGESLGHLPLHERLDRMDEAGLIYWTRTGRPRYKLFLEDVVEGGASLQDVWTDIPPINSQAIERTGYPTQKPLALMERVIAASSRPGDVVLDPFCGCGTTVIECEALDRRWIGIDISHKAMQVTIEERMAELEYEVPEVTWWPADEKTAALAARQAPLQFEYWAVRMLGGAPNPGKDRGVDGFMTFRDGNRTHRVIISVKGGRLQPAYVRDLRGTIEREDAIGVLFSLHKPSKEMRIEAKRAGFIQGETRPIPRLQLITVEAFFAGTEDGRVQAPGKNVTPKPQSYSTALLREQLQLPLAPKKARARRSKRGRKSKKAAGDE